ncbi:MAG: hypothetical protein V4465_01090 [Patescibacteria group bacterium]
MKKSPVVTAVVIGLFLGLLVKSLPSTKEPREFAEEIEGEPSFIG